MKMLVSHCFFLIKYNMFQWKKYMYCHYKLIVYKTGNQKFMATEIIAYFFNFYFILPGGKYELAYKKRQIK